MEYIPWDPRCLRLFIYLPEVPLTVWSMFSNTFSPEVCSQNLNLRRRQIGTIGPGAVRLDAQVLHILRLRAAFLMRGMILPSHCSPDDTMIQGFTDVKSWPVHVGLDLWSIAQLAAPKWGFSGKQNGVWLFYTRIHCTFNFLQGPLGKCGKWPRFILIRYYL